MEVNGIIINASRDHFVSVFSGEVDKAVRALIREADEREMTLAGRTIYISGLAGDFYGCNLVFGDPESDKNPQVRLVVQPPAVTFE